MIRQRKGSTIEWGTSAIQPHIDAIPAFTAQAFAAGIEERWTAENHAHARMLERELTALDLTWSGPARSRSPSRLRTSLVTLAAVVLLATGMAAAQAVQHGAFLSVSPTFQSLVVSALYRNGCPLRRCMTAAQTSSCVTMGRRCGRYDPTAAVAGLYGWMRRSMVHRWLWVIWSP